MKSIKKGTPAGGQRDSDQQLFVLGLAAAVIAVPAYMFYREVLQPSVPFSFCIWDRFFGFYCPGCGGTRAIEALLHGKLLASLRYHPVVGYGVFCYLFFMVSHLLQILTKGVVRGIRFRSAYLYVALMIIVANFLIRNFLRFRYGIFI